MLKVCVCFPKLQKYAQNNLILHCHCSLHENLHYHVRSPMVYVKQAIPSVESSWSIGTRVHGQCPPSPWTMSTQSMDIVLSVHGQCPLSPWAMSTQSMDNVH